jgi:signal transduction histidine kinase
LADLKRATDILQAAQDAFNAEISQAQAEIMEIYKADHKFKKELLETLKPEIQRNLAFLHDYKQFVARVKQNINVVLSRYGSGEIDQLLAKATPSEAAIYWTSSMMIEKLQTAFLLLHPEKLQSPSPTVFRLHGLVTKYIRIYNSSFVEKGVRLDVQGESLGDIRGDSTAIGVIPQTLLDNAFKYSEKGSRVIVTFQESDEAIVLSVASMGPRIEPDEVNKIFDLFYRGRNAVKMWEEGAGFGLHLAQFVALSLGTEIRVQQSPTRSRYGYETTFSVRFPRVR